MTIEELDDLVCPLCGTDNLHTNYAWHRRPVRIEKIYCNECDWEMDPGPDEDYITIER